LVLERVERAMTAELDTARHVGLIVAAAAQPGESVLERDSGFEYRGCALDGNVPVGRRPEGLERTFDRGCLILPGRPTEKPERYGSGEQGEANCTHGRIIDKPPFAGRWPPFAEKLL
jgi:hypothetical protein